MKQKTHLFFLFLVAFVLVVHAKEGEHIELDKEHWQELKKGKDYDDYKTEKLDTTDSSSNFNPNLPSRNIINSLSTVAQVCIVVIIVGIIVVFIYMAVKNNRGVASNKTFSSDLQIEIERVEADLLNMNMPQLIEQAFNNKDFHRELRLYYLWSIQLLDKLEIIEWKREKTNSAYLRELNGQEIYWKFSNITSDINEITYGKITLKTSFYERLKKELITVTSSLSSTFENENKEKA